MAGCAWNMSNDRWQDVLETCRMVDGRMCLKHVGKHILPSTRLLIRMHERNTIKVHVQVFLRMNTWMFETCRRQYNWIKSLMKRVWNFSFLLHIYHNARSKNAKHSLLLSYCSVSSKITHTVNTVYQNLGSKKKKKQELWIPEGVWRQLLYILTSYILILHLYLNLDHSK
jgi:hypothetical protein